MSGHVQSRSDPGVDTEQTGVVTFIFCHGVAAVSIQGAGGSAGHMMVENCCAWDQDLDKTHKE